MNPIKGLSNAGKVIIALTGFLSGAFCAAQLPAICKTPAGISSDIRATPSAKVYDAAGAWFVQHNDFNCGLAAFEKAVQVEPASAEAEYDLGLAHIGLKHPVEAEKHLRLALKYDPRLVAAHGSLGTILLDENRPVEAESEFRAVLATNETSVSALDNLALALSAQQRYSAAIRIWKQALALQPDSPEVTLSLGVATFKNGDAEAAMATLKPLVADHPSYKEAHFILANIMAHTLLYGEAANEYAAVVRLDPKDDGALLAYAKALSNSGSYEASRSLAEDYVRRMPADPEGHQVLGSIYRKLGDNKKAQEQLRMAIAGRPEDAQAQYEMGMALLRDQQPAEAVPYLEKASSLDPSDAPTEVALAQALRRVGNTGRAQEVTDLMLRSKERERQTTSQTVSGNQANAFLKQGEPANAVEIYRHMLEIDPKNARTAYNLALALAAMHDTKGEREALELSARLDPKMAVAESELGLMDLAAGDRPGAEQKLRAALVMDPQYAPARGNLGLVMALKGDAAEAEKLLRQAIEDDPDYVQGHLNLGLMLASREDFNDAEGELAHALMLAPNEARVRSALAKVKARLGKSDEAAALFRKNIVLSPQSADAHLDLAIALADGYNLKDALQETEVAVRLAPQSAFAQLNRGRILFDMGRIDEARASLEEACRLAPKQPDPHYYLGLLEKQQGNLQKAADLLQQVVQAQPSNVRALYFLGQSVQQSDKQAAIDHWRRAAAIDPSYTPALWSLTRSLATADPVESKHYDDQLKAVLDKAHDLDAAELTANDAISSMQAHDWPQAVKGMKEAIRICGGCAAKASLHKSLGLAYCQAGDLANGERELRFSESVKAGDPDVQRALALIAQAKGSRS